MKTFALPGPRTHKPLATAFLTLTACTALVHCTGTPGPMDVPSGTDVQDGGMMMMPDVPPGTDVQPGVDTPIGADVPIPPPTSAAVTMFGYDLARSAANRGERTLTVAALMAGRLGRDTAFAPRLDGDVYAQPLYLPGVSVMGAMHDVLFVGTQNNTVYALDAVTGAALWNTNLGRPVPLARMPCGNISPNTGVLGTAVIDTASGTLYAVSYTTPDAGVTKVFSLNALDVTTGMQRAGYPAPIRPPMINGSTFDPAPHGERGAISLIGGRVYVPFGGLYGDCGTYHGWVVGINPAMPTQQVSWATPGRASGIWAPAGFSSDGTNIFAATGNGFTTGSQGEYVVRLATGAAGPTLATGNTNFFTPSDRDALDAQDVDIGSVAPIILPDHAGSSTPHLLFQAGKAGVAYLLNRDNLGGQSAGDGVNGEGVFSARIFAGGIFGSYATWTNGTDVYVFTPGSGRASAPCTTSGGIMAIRLRAGAGGGSEFAPAWCAGTGNNVTPSVSSNGNSDGILWEAVGGSTTVRAFNIADGTQIFTASDASMIRKWVPPVVADGRVYITGANTVSMYRLVR